MSTTRGRGSRAMTEDSKVYESLSGQPFTPST